MLSDLIRAERDGDRLTADELRMLAAGLLLAGTDTTRNQAAASIDVLLDHPDQWELLRDHFHNNTALDPMLVQIQGGQVKAIAPPDSAQAQIIYPLPPLG